MFHTGSKRPTSERFGEQIPFSEPYWYQGFHSPYYGSTHEVFRDGLRLWLDENVRPNMEDWIENKKYPPSLHEKFYKAGFNGCIFPAEFGGTPPTVSFCSPWLFIVRHASSLFLSLLFAFILLPTN
jgi:alkylation response protein AidB-like acyl-CoA dehydrogenase